MATRRLEASNQIVNLSLEHKAQLPGLMQNAVDELEAANEEFEAVQNAYREYMDRLVSLV